MELHLVGGFLGSGKTTAIITIAKHLIQSGKKVGVVTNDQGKYLVDTSFFRSENIPTVEVTNGCFCCNYDSLDEKLAQLKENDQPDIIFAESVGSCGDLVATVIKPLLELSGGETPPTSFSVFTDSRLLLAYLQGEELPFSDNVTYIFIKQIEEAAVLVINKIDLLTADEISQTLALANKAFPEKTILCQNSKDLGDTLRWYACLSEGSSIASTRSIEMDYSRYGSGEAELAWFDQELSIQTTAGDLIPIISAWIERIQEKIKRLQINIGHIKFLISTPTRAVKISLPTLENTGWRDDLTTISASSLSLLINARVQTTPEILNELISSSITEIFSSPEITISAIKSDFFKPGFPSPTHRIGGNPPNS